jgi:hypothetical protein
MKRVVLIFLLSVILTLAIVAAYSIFKFNVGFKPEKESFDTYLGYGENVRDRLLKNRLKYKLKTRYTDYKKDNYKILYMDYPLTYYFLKKKPDEMLGKLRKWCDKDKRAIVFYNTDNNFDLPDDMTDDKEPAADISSDQYDDYESYMDATSVKIESSDPLFEGVNYLTLNANCDINIAGYNLKPLLKVDEKTIVAREEINGGEIIYIADYHVFADKNILKDDNAVFLNNLLKKYYKDEIIFDKYAGYASTQEKSFIEMSGFPFIFMQLAILFIVFFLAYFKRFGSPLDMDLYKKRSVVRHLESVGYFFEKCRKDDIIVKIFDQYFMERLLKIIKIRASDEKNFISDLEKRFGLSKEDMKLFYFNNDNNIQENQIKREKFLRKFKKENL